MNRLIAVILLGIGGGFLTASAQETFFGKNKVQYRDFDWSYIQSRHFDIYFYDDGYPMAKFTAEVMESSYVEISGELGWKLQKRVPIFVYNSHNDFQQTNITQGLLPDGVGGFTEAFKNRIVIPFTGSYEDMRHVLHHELTHAVTFDILFGGSLASVIARQRLFNMPLWFAEGYAEYSSRHGWDYWSDMYVRDATINDYLAPPGFIGGFLAYKQGQAMVKHIAERYGERKIGEILQKGKIHLSMDRAFQAATGEPMEEFWTDFEREMKRRYWPEIALRKEPAELGKQLTRSGRDNSFFNEKPVWHPDGDKIALFTDRSDYTEIVLVSAQTGETIKRLAGASRSADIESLRSFVSGTSFSPDGRSLVFVAQTKGRDALYFVDTKSGDIFKRKKFDFYHIVDPVWSPDGQKVAFSALAGHMRDIYVYDIENDAVERLTFDRFDDVDPSWMPNSSEIVYASDRPHPETPMIDANGQPYVSYAGAFMPGDFDYGSYNLFRQELGNGGPVALSFGPGQNTNPIVAPDGKRIAFISNRNGIDNIYVGYLETGEQYAVTDILTGIRHHNWSPDGEKIVFSAFHRGAFDIFVLDELVPAGDSGVLEPTGYVKGDYDRLKTDDDTVDTTATVVAMRNPRAAPSPETAVPPSTISDDENPDVQTAVADEGTATDGSPAVASVPDDNEGEPAADSSQSGGTIYDDEYVYESDISQAGLDSMLRVVPSENYKNVTPPMEEPASFDSIAGRLPSGEYRVKDYKVRFSADYIGGGFGYNTFFGLSGQTFFLFSDYLGDHTILVGADLVSSIDQSFIQATYINSTRRINWGVGAFHTKNFYLEPRPDIRRDLLFSDRFYGVSFLAARPSSRFRRWEANFTQSFIDRQYYDERFLPSDRRRDNRSAAISSLELSHVFDNVLWGWTGPVNGTRYKLSLETGASPFNPGEVEFYAAELDYRRYWHFAKTYSMAFRVAGAASFGATPKQYFLGGTTNWIGSRDLDPTVYEVENLYFADVVTPLRGVPYYEISGDRYALVNWEFRYPVLQVLAMRFPLPLVISNIRGAVFADAGAAWFGNDFKFGTSEGGRTRLADVRSGFGFGLRMNLFGLALLRWDLAWGTDFNTVTDRPTSYFSLGADF